MKYFSVRKESNGKKLPKYVAQRLILKGFKEFETTYEIPIDNLTKKTWRSVLPIAS